jgi:DNA-binding GntR family transcriptional regulator
MVRKIKRKTLHEVIANNLREMIMAGELKKGDKIKEHDLCTSMDVSKTPLREALKVLNAEGIIKLIHNRGAYVSRPTHEEIKEMFDVMSVLEGACARAAVEKMTDNKLLTLGKIHKKLEENFQDNNRKGYIYYNNLYHGFLQKIAGNHTLNQIVNGLRKKILLYRFESLSNPKRFEKSLKEHRSLQKAFQSRDPKLAEKLMRNHLEKAGRAVTEIKE